MKVSRFLIDPPKRNRLGRVFAYWWNELVWRIWGGR
jgi:hypothetical protein